MAFFDYDVVSHDTRYENDPRVANFGNNILKVRFLTKYGAQLLCDDDGKTVFYYQVRDVQLIITMNIKGKKRLINKLQKLMGYFVQEFGGVIGILMTHPELYAVN